MDRGSCGLRCVRNQKCLQCELRAESCEQAMINGIVIQVNGESRETAAGTTVRELLDQLGLNAGRVAIEYNLQILAKTKWEETRVASGDKLEIGQFVGGG